MDQFIDPTLLNKDLSVSPMFTKYTDWYAFSVLLFKALTYVHPYGGTYPKMRNIFDRMTNKVSIFNSDVKYPKVGIQYRTLGNELLSYFNDIFTNGKRIEISADRLNQLSNEFTQCPSCNTWYNGNKCQLCNITIPSSSISTHGCDDVTILKTTDVITHVSLSNDKILIFTEDLHGEAKILRRDYIVSDHMYEYEILRGDTYKRFKGGHVTSHKNVLYINDYIKTTTMLFNNVSQFGCSDKYLYRLASDTLLRCDLRNGVLIETSITKIIENQTQIWVSLNDIIIGYMRTLNKHQYFVHYNGSTIHFELSNVYGSILDQNVEFSKDRALILTKTMYKGKTYTCLNIVDIRGKLLESRSEPTLNSRLLNTIHGKQLVGSSIVHPTDDGIVIECKTDESLKSSTEPYVSSDSKLLMYKDGILVIDSHEIKYLTLR
jgi:hypothetical protein